MAVGDGNSGPRRSSMRGPACVVMLALAVCLAALVIAVASFGAGAWVFGGLRPAAPTLGVTATRPADVPVTRPAVVQTELPTAPPPPAQCAGSAGFSDTGVQVSLT